MMTVYGSGGMLSFQGEKQYSVFAPVRRTTPFSIDDILSGSRENDLKSHISDNGNCKVEAETIVRKHLFDEDASRIFWKNQELYLLWLERLRTLYAANSFQPFWYSLMSATQGAGQARHFEKPSSNIAKGKCHLLSDLRNYPHRQSRTVNHRLQRHSRVRRLSGSYGSGRVKQREEAQEQLDAMLDTEPIRSGFENSTEQLKESIALTSNPAKVDSPLNALEKLACATFKEMEEKQTILQAISSSREAKMKKRKCRTAFNAFQLAILEQRFNCHRYLTPTDRDQIAQQLDLSAPQVITWFQNRRAKQKRDLEEKENDIKTIKVWKDKSRLNSSPQGSSLSDEEDLEVDVESC